MKSRRRNCGRDGFWKGRLGHDSGTELEVQGHNSAQSGNWEGAGRLAEGWKEKVPGRTGDRGKQQLWRAFSRNPPCLHMHVPHT